MLKEGLEYLHEKFTRPENYPRELAKWYKKNTGRDLDLNDPRTYNEKIQWIKLYYKNPLITTLSDKYLVRDFIKDKIGEEYLVPLHGVYDKFSEIDFDKLPSQFVLKTNHGSGWNIVVRDKSRFNRFKAGIKFAIWLRMDYSFTTGFQMHYSPIKPKIIVEKYLENDHGMLRDYKVLVFAGKAHYIWVDSDRLTDHHRTVFNLDWTLPPFNIGIHDRVLDVPEPVNREKMIELAEILGADFPAVRVDFYEVDGRLYFGEMTFTCGSGLEEFIPYEYDRVVGDLIPLP